MITPLTTGMLLSLMHSKIIQLIKKETEAPARKLNLTIKF